MAWAQPQAATGSESFPISRAAAAFVRTAARSAVPVLIEGETGTGKTHLAYRIHHAGPRRERPFVRVDCGALPESIFAGELFGHERGAYTGANARQEGLIERADGGTLFLDEIGEVPQRLQPTLLTFMDERTVRRLGSRQHRLLDVRIVAATNQSLHRLVREKRFREDLYYRCRVLYHEVAPLRARPGALPALVPHLLASIAREARPWDDGSPLAITDDASAALARYPWPGNIRELRAALLEAALRLSERESTIRLHHLPDRIVSPGPDPLTIRMEPASPDRDLRYRAPPDPARERTRVIEALRSADGNKTHAARLLGMSRQTLYNKLRDLGIPARNGRHANGRQLDGA